MKHGTKLINFSDFSAGVDEFLAALEPNDVIVLGGTLRRLGAFRDLAVRLLQPAQPLASDHSGLEERVTALAARLANSDELAAVTADEVAKLHGLVIGLGDRIVAQGELLSKRAEKSEPEPVAIPLQAPGPTVLDDPEADLAPVQPTVLLCEPEYVETARAVLAATDPVPQSDELRLTIARTLGMIGAAMPKTLAENLDLPVAAVEEQLQHAWFVRRSGRGPIVYRLTEAGEIAAAATEPDPTRPAVPRQTSPRSTKLVADAIMETEEPDLAVQEIAEETGLASAAVTDALSDEALFVQRENGRWGLTAKGIALARKAVSK